MLYAQYGGKATQKIQDGLREGVIGGVILDPRAHKPDKMTEFMTELKAEFPTTPLLFDSNFHAFSFPSSDSLGKLPSYPFSYGHLGRMDYSSSKISEYVKKVIDYQISMDFDLILSPSVCFESFDDRWAQISLNLHQEAIEYAKSKGVVSKLVLTIVVSESALRDEVELAGFLNDLTLMTEVRGFYIIVDRSTQGFLQWSDPTTLSGLMYLCNVLSEADFEVILGYIDLVGLLPYAVGASHIVNGWFKNLRQFSRERYVHREGRQPKDTYTSGPLLNSIYVNPELQVISEHGMLSEVMSNSGYDDVLMENPASQPWHIDVASMHHWKTLKGLMGKVDECASPSDRLSTLVEMIENARVLYSRLTSGPEAVPFEPTTGPAHLRVWLDAINIYKEGL